MEIIDRYLKVIRDKILQAELKNLDPFYKLHSEFNFYNNLFNNKKIKEKGIQEQIDIISELEINDLYLINLNSGCHIDFNSLDLFLNENTKDASIEKCLLVYNSQKARIKLSIDFESTIKHTLRYKYSQIYGNVRIKDKLYTQEEYMSCISKLISQDTIGRVIKQID